MLFVVVLSAQVQVSQTEVLDLGTNVMNGVFSDDGNYLLFSSLDGAKYYDFRKDKSQLFADAAYDFKMDENGRIRYRVDSFVDQLKVNSVKIFDSRTKETETILDRKRLDVVPAVTDHGVYYIEKDMVKTDNKLAKPVSKPVIMPYHDGLLLYTYGTSKVLRPAGEEKFYIWPAISPDNSKISFVDIHDLYVTDLNGDVEFIVKEARAPKWSPDGKWIAFMRDSDDGHAFVSSDIFVVRVADQEVFQLTDTDDRIEMNPSWSPDGKKIVCDDAQNDNLIILTLDIK